MDPNESRMGKLASSRSVPALSGQCMELPNLLASWHTPRGKLHCDPQTILRASLGQLYALLWSLVFVDNLGCHPCPTQTKHTSNVLVSAHDKNPWQPKDWQEED